MRNKKQKRGNKLLSNKLILMGIGLVLLFSFIFLATASDNKTALQNELNNLTSQLNNQGYLWLVNTSIDYDNINDTISVGVYRQGDSNILAQFNDLTGSFGRHQIFLTGLGDNEPYTAFDLRSVENIEKIPKEILLIKMRIDEIRGGLNNINVYKMRLKSIK